MAVIGSITCFPSQKFAMPRSYVWGIGVRAGFAAAVWTDRSVDLINPSTGALYWRTTFTLKWWTWSSNRYTLDYIPEECYYYPTIFSPPTPLNVFVWYEIHPVTCNPLVVISPFGGQPYLYESRLPGAPAGYWLPPFAE